VFSIVAGASVVAQAGPAYPIETHIACADAVVEAQLAFKKPVPPGWKPERGFPRESRSTLSDLRESSTSVAAPYRQARSSGTLLSEKCPTRDGGRRIGRSTPGSSSSFELNLMVAGAPWSWELPAFGTTFNRPTRRICLAPRSLDNEEGRSVYRGLSSVGERDNMALQRTGFARR